MNKLFRYKLYQKKVLLFTLVAFLFACEKYDLDWSYEPPNIKIHQTSLLNFTVDKPWEKIGLGYINVLNVDSTWHMWYESFDEISGSIGRSDYNGYFCYATSKDGINWAKPNIGLITYGGNKNNNILISNAGISNAGIHGVTVFIDSLSLNKKEYFKMVYSRWDNELFTSRVYGMTSTDGINWKNEKLLINHRSDTQNVCFNDNGTYKLYLRYWNGGSHQNGFRQIAYCESSNFSDSFSKISPVYFNDGPDIRKIHLYNNSVNKISNSLYVSFPSIFSPETDKMQITIGYNISNNPTQFSFYDIGDTGLIERPDKYGGIYAAPNLIHYRENSYWLYFMSTLRGHSSRKYPEYKFQGEIKRVLIEIEN